MRDPFLPRPLRRLVNLPAAAAALLATAAAPPPPVPQRIVSLNMCADQLVIALADRHQIAGLTEWARDPSLSYYAARARTLPFTHRSAEEVIALRPDLVIGAPFRTRAVLKPLKARGVAMVDLPHSDSVAEMTEAITTIADAVGHPERGRALNARIAAELAALGPPPGRGRVAAFYQRRGYLTGTGTLVDDMMRRAGLTNLAGRMGLGPLAQLGLERIALARPDFLVMDDGVRGDGDRGAQMLRHPLLARAVPPRRHLFIPQALTVCGTPGYPKAVAMLMRQVRAADGPAVTAR